MGIPLEGKEPTPAAATRDLPASRHDLSNYWGRVKHSAGLSDPRQAMALFCNCFGMMFVSSATLEHSKRLIAAYRNHELPETMTPELWHAKKVVDSTLHPDTGEKVFLPFRMSCYVLSNLVVTAGMLTPGLGTAGTLGWQVANQSLNVAINNANANKSTPLSWSTMAKSYCMAVSASCGVAYGLNAIVPRLKSVKPSTKIVLGRLIPFAAVVSAGVVNVFLMRGEEIRRGIDVYPVRTPEQIEKGEKVESLGRSKKAATLAVGETALSRVINATPIMVLPPLILLKLQKTKWLSARPRMVTPVNLGLILATSYLALPFALGVFPQFQSISVDSLEKEFHGRGGKDGLVEFNRGI